MNKRGKMSKRERIETVILYGIFAFYMMLIIKILFLSRVSHLEHRSINLIPFKSIAAFVSGSTANLKTFAFGNVAGNILIFVPFGVYLPLFKQDKRLKTNLLFILIASLVVEIIQGLVGIGTSDIDDIILNGLGGCIGILGYKLLLILLRNEKRVHTAVTILSVLGLPAILFYLFMVKMRF